MVVIHSLILLMTMMIQKDDDSSDDDDEYDDGIVVVVDERWNRRMIRMIFCSVREGRFVDLSSSFYGVLLFLLLCR
jgi:hypothetical protein